MRRHTKLFTILCGTLLLINLSQAEPPNLGVLKQELRQYHDEGLYEHDLTTVIGEAKRYLLEAVAKNEERSVKRNLAIVLDIDETSISNYDKFAKRDFIATPAQLRQDMLDADSPAIKATLSLYQEALKHGVHVFFVTGRPQQYLEATKANLQRDGYHEWTGLYLRPDTDHQTSIVAFKSKTRALIAKQGYTIVESIGDQYSDLLGGQARRVFKLPNPYYFLP